MHIFCTYAEHTQQNIIFLPIISVMCGSIWNKHQPSIKLWRDTYAEVFLYTMLLITETARWYRYVYWLRRRRLKGIGITIIDLRRSDDRLGFIMEIPIPVRRCHFSEWRPWWPVLPVQVEMSQLSLYIYLKFDKAYKLHFGFGVICHRGTYSIYSSKIQW